MRVTLAIIVGSILLGLPATAKLDTSDPLAVAFGTMPKFWGAQLSPDGSKLLTLQVHEDKRQGELIIAVVLDMNAREQRVLLASERNRFKIEWCKWANNERLLCGSIGDIADGKWPVSEAAIA